jgi:purine nucleosidase
MPRKILIDTDPGIDDAMAILLALRSPEFEVVGLTTMFGNAYVEQCTHNALFLLELEGNGHIPVAQGSGQPLALPLGRVGHFVHGEDGMGNIQPPAARASIDGRSAAQFIVDMVSTYPGEITLVPLGPLTNIALALRLAPHIAGLVKEVVIMGGSAYAVGNITPAAEANIHADPHAAEIVFSAGWPLTMVGLDVTTRIIMTPDYLEELFRPKHAASDLMRRSQPVYQAFHHTAYGLNGSIQTHDPAVIAYLLAPHLFKTADWPVYVETSGLCRGQTIPDPRRQWGDRPTTRVCMDVDAQGVLDLIKERFSS